jgi:hypothetical protein
LNKAIAISTGLSLARTGRAGRALAGRVFQFTITLPYCNDFFAQIYHQPYFSNFPNTSISGKKTKDQVCSEEKP